MQIFEGKPSSRLLYSVTNPTWSALTMLYILFKVSALTVIKRILFL
jgi:hypothetical protein